MWQSCLLISVLDSVVHVIFLLTHKDVIMVKIVPKKSHFTIQRMCMDQNTFYSPFTL